jgi:hypothetical protein
MAATKTLTWAVCLEGALVTREMANGWLEDDEVRAVILGWEDLPDEGAEYRGGPLRATALAAAIKEADPDELVQVLLWTDEDLAA